MPINGSLLAWLSYFLLIVIRMSGIFVASPILGRANIPRTVRVLFSVMLSFIVVNMIVPPSPELIAPGLPGYVIMCVKELLVGLCIGFVNTLFFSAVFVAGQIIDMQVGFGMVQIFDVQSNIQIPIVGSILNLMLLETFVLTNGHVRVIQIMYQTYELVPIGKVTFGPEIGAVIISSFVQTFTLAINIAMPIIASGLLTEVALGIIVRTSPQMNVFVVGISLKVVLGMIMLYVMVPVFTRFTGTLFDGMFHAMDSVIRTMAG